MTTTPPIRLEVELSFTGQSVRGVLRTPDGEGRPFDGWLQLMSAVERLRPPPEAAINADGGT